MKRDLEAAIAGAVHETYGVEVRVDLSHPDEKFGDYATNVALKIAKDLQKAPHEIAEELRKQLLESLGDRVSDVTIAGPGFINVKLSDSALIAATNIDITELNTGKRLLLEYSCPNAFKELHTGHLYQTVVGDAIGKIFKATGGEVYRANFGGDVGLHVAKCMYGIVEVLGGEDPAQLASVPAEDRAEWLSAAYVNGAKAYEEDESAKTKITEYNTAIYIFHSNDDHQTDLAQIYWTCREWSYDYFKDFYQKIETSAFDKYYPESTTSDRGLGVVRENTGSVFHESDGAVVYDGEKVGLHTRVFITSKGLPTYETKDLGVIYNESDDFEYDARVIITGNDQSEYMKVVFAALKDIDAELAVKQNHLAHGTVRFGSGQKMSSRLGNVTRAIDVIEETDKTVSAERPDSDHYLVTLAAVKYSFIKHRIGGDIAFDIQESVSLEGNSGPYLQYAHARARSILSKSESTMAIQNDLQQGERTLVQKLSEYPEVIQRAATDFMPHYVATYLYELAQVFNHFYEHNRVIGDERESQRLALVQKYADTLNTGLDVLGIPAPDRM